jgi:glycosyltransferase involved in cell wall biosynthesis
VSENLSEKVMMFQVGAREHYAVARAFHELGVLDWLVTDFWLPPGKLASAAPLSMRGRWHEALREARIKAFNRQCLLFESRSRLTDQKGWAQMMDRNRWFQGRAVKWLEKQLPLNGQHPPVIASYSYAASRLFFAGKRLGCRTIMFQIDPGPAEEDILLGIERKHPELIKMRVVAPREYWSDWKLQCELADIIVVNSEWSRRCLIDADVVATKIRILPLAFEKEAGPDSGQPKDYPGQFSAERPLKVLFLGQVNLRKGMGEIFQALRTLRQAPLEIWFAGPEQLIVPEEFRRDPRIKWLGMVPRMRVDEFYREADVFLFPTHSDGFGLTQLEAQDRRLPIIASRFCGSVVRHGVNGLVISEVSGREIARALDWCISHPRELAEMSRNSYVAEEFRPAALKSSIRTLLDELATLPQ